MFGRATITRALAHILVFLVCLSIILSTKSTKLAADVSYTGHQNCTKFGTLINRVLLHIISNTDELWLKGSTWGAKIHVAKIVTLLVNRLA